MDPVRARATDARGGVRCEFLMLCCALLCMGWGVVAAAGALYAGRRVVDVLQEVRTSGIALVYNDRQVPDSWVIAREPAAKTGAALLKEILAPFGLALSDIGPGAYAVIAARAAPGPRSAEAARRSAAPDEVVVSTSRYALAVHEPAIMLTQSDVHSLPRLGEETLRAIQRLPGTATNGFSGLPSIRGGEPGETLIVLDGLALVEPFHLKNFLSPMSLLDSRIVQSLEVYSGGFPVEYGGRMSAVIDAQSQEPPANRYYELGLSVFHSQGLISDSFDQQRGHWLVALRRSNLDEVAHWLESNFGEPEYLDGFAKLDYAFSDATQASFHFLSSHDHIVATDPSSHEQADATYRNAYSWATLTHSFSDSWSSQLTASYTDIENNRGGTVDDPQQRSGEVNDERAFYIAGLTSELDYREGRASQRWGLQVQRVAGEYDYQSRVTMIPTLLFPGISPTMTRRRLALREAGWQYAAYWNSRVELSPRWVTELGLRWDQQTYAPNANQLAPRMSVLFNLSSSTRLRATWGRFFQAQSINELQVEDGLTHFFAPQRADHWVLSFEHEWQPGSSLRVEAYRKNYRQLRPRFENLFGPLVLLPELRADRVEVMPTAARSEGVDLMYSFRTQAPWSGWLSYSWSKAVDEIGGVEVPRSWDQRHTINAGLRWSRGAYDVTLADTYHSGWPTTNIQSITGSPITAVTLGPRNDARLGSYNSLDLRASRHVPWLHGQLEMYLEVTNLLDRNNPCCISYSVAPGDTSVAAKQDNWLGIVPSVGVLWQH